MRLQLLVTLRNQVSTSSRYYFWSWCEEGKIINFYCSLFQHSSFPASVQVFDEIFFQGLPVAGRWFYLFNMSTNHFHLIWKWILVQMCVTVKLAEQKKMIVFHFLSAGNYRNWKITETCNSVWVGGALDVLVREMNIKQTQYTNNEVHTGIHSKTSFSVEKGFSLNSIHTEVFCHQQA